MGISIRHPSTEMPAAQRCRELFVAPTPGAYLLTPSASTMMTEASVHEAFKKDAV